MPAEEAAEEEAAEEEKKPKVKKNVKPALTFPLYVCAVGPLLGRPGAFCGVAAAGPDPGRPLVLALGSLRTHGVSRPL